MKFVTSLKSVLCVLSMPITDMLRMYYPLDSKVIQLLKGGGGSYSYSGQDKIRFVRNIANLTTN